MKKVIDEYRNWKELLPFEKRFLAYIYEILRAHKTDYDTWTHEHDLLLGRQLVRLIKSYSNINVLCDALEKEIGIK